MRTSQFALLPRDGLFLKDGRGWYTSAVGRSHSHPWPWPPTVRGAVCHAYGHALMQYESITLSPTAWEQRTSDIAITKLLTLRCQFDHRPVAHNRLWPCPADAWYGTDAECVQRLEPEPPRHAGLGDRQDPARARLRRPYPGKMGKPTPRPRFWPDETMLHWLRGASTVQEPGLNPPQRTDTHVTITAATQTATQSMLFASEVTETLECESKCEPSGYREWGLAVDCSLPPGEVPFPSGLFTVGGRRRLAHVAAVDRDLFAAPPDLGGDSQGLRLILATPAYFARGWLPDQLAAGSENEYQGCIPGIDETVILRAALVPPPLDLSTWDMKERKPRPTWRLVRPGAVYYFHKVSERPFTNDERQRLWLMQWGGKREYGFGLVIPGCWDCK